jgi:hypothetical protein
MTAWRWRQCPRCGIVGASSAYAVVGGYQRGWTEDGSVRRRCPVCSFEGPTGAFQVVREARKDNGRAA